MKKEHGNTTASFLDLDIEIVNNRFVTKLYDKRDSFPFKIVRMPDRSSNIPSKIFSSSIGAETLRIARISSSSESFISSCQNLFERMLRQGASKPGIKIILRKLYGKHEIFKNFGANSRVFVDQLL